MHFHELRAVSQQPTHTPQYVPLQSEPRSYNSNVLQSLALFSVHPRLASNVSVRSVKRQRNTHRSMFIRGQDLIREYGGVMPATSLKFCRLWPPKLVITYFRIHGVLKRAVRCKLENCYELKFATILNTQSHRIERRHQRLLRALVVILRIQWHSVQGGGEGRTLFACTASLL